MEFVLESSVDRFQYSRGTKPAIKGIDLKVRQGEFVVITGPAGAGKTTLCYCLAGVIPHFVFGDYVGSVKVKGRSLAELRLPEIAGRIGFMFQRPENQLFSISVEEDVAFGPENLCLDPSEVCKRVERSLAFVGMEAFAGRMCGALSGGETQRIVLSCILAMDPDVFVLDQPAAELDPLGRQKIYENIGRLNRDAGKTVILVEDRLSDVLPYASRIILMHEGHVTKDASPEEIFADERVLSCGIRVPDTVKLHHSLKSSGLSPERVCFTLPGIADHLKPPMRPATPAASSNRPQSIAGMLPSGATQHAVQVRDLSYRYPGSDRWALDGVNLEFGSGEFAAIIGENGAGKTTLAKHLIGILRPTRGNLIVMGRDIRAMSTAQLSDTVGFLFQDPDLQIFCNSVFDEVAFSLKTRKVPREQIAPRVNRMLQKLGLLSLSESHPYLLSRGQRQRLALASILVHNPEVLVVDEPSTGLDYRETLEIMDLLTEFRGQEGTVIMITHDMEMVVRYAERSIVLAEGRLLADIATRALGNHTDVLAEAGIRLPDFCLLASALDLPPTYRNVEEVVRGIVEGYG